MQNQIIHDHIAELECMDECDRDALITELKDNQHNIKSNNELYYNEHQDKSWIAHYYCNIGFESPTPIQLFHDLRKLVIKTHKYKHPYYVSKDQYLYTWVDLQPNGQLKNIYSGIEKNPQIVINEDLDVIQRRYERYRKLILNQRVSSKEIKRQVRDISKQHKFNAEHVVPQSWFNAKEPMKGDLHHLFACEPDCNVVRSNFAYYEFRKAEYLKNVRNQCGIFEMGRFEPEYGKGTVARATFYFLLRYPKKIKRQYRKKINIALLRRWHVQFPVNEYEKHRNKAIFEIQGNRNPFIDFPELINRLKFPFEN